MPTRVRDVLFLDDGLYKETLRMACYHAGCCSVGEQGEEVHIQPITGT